MQPHGVGVDQKAFRTWFDHQDPKCNVLDGSACSEGVLPGLSFVAPTARPALPLGSAPQDQRGASKRQNHMQFSRH